MAKMKAARTMVSPVFFITLLIFSVSASFHAPDLSSGRPTLATDDSTSQTLSQLSTSIPTVSQNTNQSDSDNDFVTHTDLSISKGSICVLLLYTMLGSVFQPLPGSLIFGPTSRFWRASPLSALIETILIIYRLSMTAYTSALPRLKAAFVRSRHRDGSLPITTSQRESWQIVKSVLRESLALMVIRSLNSSDDNYMKISSIPNTAISRRAKFFRKIVCERQEAGLWIRMGIMVPIVSQYVKLMVIKGPSAQTVLPKVLGSIYFVHCITIELLSWLAIRQLRVRPRREGLAERVPLLERQARPLESETSGEQAHDPNENELLVGGQLDNLDDASLFRTVTDFSPSLTSRPAFNHWIWHIFFRGSLSYFKPFYGLKYWPDAVGTIDAMKSTNSDWLYDNVTCTWTASAIVYSSTLGLINFNSATPDRLINPNSHHTYVAKSERLNAPLLFPLDQQTAVRQPNVKTDKKRQQPTIWQERRLMYDHPVCLMHGWLFFATLLAVMLKLMMVRIITGEQDLAKIYNSTDFFIFLYAFVLIPLYTSSANICQTRPGRCGTRAMEEELYVFTQTVCMANKCRQWICRPKCLRHSLELFKTEYKSLRDRPTMEIYEWKGFGGQIGKVFVVIWVFWCVLAWRSEGTAKPSWGWLDWLG